MTANRVVALHRGNGTDEALVIGSLTTTRFRTATLFRWVASLSGQWKEVFNSDGAAYGEATSAMGAASDPS